MHLCATSPGMLLCWQVRHAIGKTILLAISLSVCNFVMPVDILCDTISAVAPPCGLSTVPRDALFKDIGHTRSICTPLRCKNCTAAGT